MSEAVTPDDHVIVVFGATGDLAKRKLLPALYHLAEEGWMPRRYRIIGIARNELSDEGFRALAREAVDEFCRCETTDSSWKTFSDSLSYVSHEFGPGDTDPLVQSVQRAEGELGNGARRLYYLAVPPPAFTPITGGLGASGLSDHARIVYEKPFGMDLASARKLNEEVHSVFDESSVYRIDHFLGRETVQNILALRFANGMFEPVWNRNHIEHVQIDVPEEIGIGTRAGFYEKTGALRDMIVTHLFQVLSVVALEPPASFRPKALVDEKVKVFDAMVPLRPEDVVRGQYDGYRAEEGVAQDSDTETFVAARVFVDNWRWTGVPFYLRTGKRLAEMRRTVTIAFREPPHSMFSHTGGDGFGCNYLTLELGAPEGVSATFLAKVPGPTIELGPARMSFRYEGHFGSELIEAYERLIHDALIDDHTLFTRADGIERSWEVAAPVLSEPPPVHAYAQGSWGPEAADELIAPRDWYLPADPV